MSIQQAVYDAMKNYKAVSENYWRTHKDYNARLEQETRMRNIISQFDVPVQHALYRLSRDIGSTTGVKWELTLSDIETVCKLAEFADLYCYCKDYGLLDVMQKVFELQDRAQLNQLSVLTRFHYWKKDGFALMSPEQWTQFAEFRSNFVLNNTKTTSLVFETQPQEMKTMPIQPDQWIQLDALYKELVSYKKHEVCNTVRRLNNSDNFEFDDCSDREHGKDIPKSFSQLVESESFTDSKKAYAALCLLSQCFFIQTKCHTFFGGPPKGWTPPPLTEQEKSQENTERKNQLTAYALFDELVGGDIRYRWAFHFCHKARLLNYSLACRIISQPPETCGIIASAALIARDVPCSSWQTFFDILESIIDPQLDGCSEEKTRELLKDNLDHSENSYSNSPPSISENNFPILILALVWLWMSFHDIAHQSNADMLLNLGRKVLLLYSVTLINEYHSFYLSEPFPKQNETHRADHQALLEFVISSVARMK